MLWLVPLYRPLSSADYPARDLLPVFGCAEDSAHYSALHDEMSTNNVRKTAALSKPPC